MPASAGTDDARIGAVVVLDDIGSGLPMTGTAECPGRKRALGGGIVQSGGPPNGPLLRQSVPLDGSGTVAGTSGGDRPKQWQVLGQNFSGVARDFRIFAVCAKANVRVALKRFDVPGQGLASASVRCPRRTRVVGGGASLETPIQGFLTANGPTAGSFAATRSGIAARRWTATLDGQNAGALPARVYAICAKGSKAKMEVDTTHHPGGTTLGVEPRCPGGKVALGGGIIHDVGLQAGYAITTLGPLDASGVTANTGVGDKARSYYGALDSFDAPATGRVKTVAICE